LEEICDIINSDRRKKSKKFGEQIERKREKKETAEGDGREWKRRKTTEENRR